MKLSFIMVANSSPLTRCMRKTYQKVKVALPQAVASSFLFILTGMNLFDSIYLESTISLQSLLLSVSLPDNSDPDLLLYFLVYLTTV
jgi:hypothetical protein